MNRPSEAAIEPLFVVELTDEELLAEDGPLWSKARRARALWPKGARVFPSFEAWREDHSRFDFRWCRSCFPLPSDLEAVGVDPARYGWAVAA